MVVGTGQLAENPSRWNCRYGKKMTFSPSPDGEARRNRSRGGGR